MFRTMDKMDKVDPTKKMDVLGKMIMVKDLKFAFDSESVDQVRRYDELCLMVMMGMSVSSPSKALEYINNGYSIVVHGRDKKKIDCELLRRNANTRDNKTIIVKRMFKADGSFDASEISAADAAALIASMEGRRISAIQGEGMVRGSGYDPMKEGVIEGEETIEEGGERDASMAYWEQCLKRFSPNTLMVLETLPSRGGRVVV